MSSKLDVLVVNPGDVKHVYQQLGDKFSAIEPPVIATAVASYLRNKEYSVDILDVPANRLSSSKAAEIINDRNPTLVAIIVYGFQPSASSQNMPSAGAIAKKVKKLNPNTKIIMAGTHPAALPERTLKEESVDFVCVGEESITIKGVVDALKSNESNFSKIPGICYQDNGHIQKTDPPDLIGNLDEEIPEMAYDLLPMDNYRAHNWHCFDHIEERMPYVSIHTSLGCPFKCHFCCINTPYSGPDYEFRGPRYRMWNPETVIKWIDKLVQDYGVKNIKIADEMFVLNASHVHGLCDLLIERDYDLNIWAYARVDTVKDEFLEKLKSAGIRWLALGIESASEHVRDGADKHLNDQDIVDIVEKISDSGIYIVGNYIFGLPDDNLETMQHTLSLAMDLNTEWANFYSAMAYPGSPLYQTAKDNDLPLPDDPDGPGWIGYSQHSYETLPLPTDYVGSDGVLRFRDNAFQAYFTNPKYLKMIKKKFGQRTVNHINEMTSLPPLSRKILE